LPAVVGTARPESSRYLTAPIDIAPDDPIIAFFQSAAGAVEIDKLELDSPALATLKQAGITLAVPLVSQGELVGLLNLGPRLSEQEYSPDDRTLLNNLAAQAAPALRVAQLVRQQQAEALARERIEHELRVARLIQQALLPKRLPDLPGWRMAAAYLPAHAVGGDFYDFIDFPDGRLGIVIGDVTDKGVPAAMVMATTRSALRASAATGVSPGAVLERVNNLLYPDMPPKMFVTCLYAILDPTTGHFHFANAGHDLPYCRTETGVQELRATGMPLGLMPDMRYEEQEAVLPTGSTLLLYSDGLVEAHSPSREMFSFPRLKRMLGELDAGTGVIDRLLAALASFTGPGWEQEDDVTLVALYHQPAAVETDAMRNGSDRSWHELAAFSLPSQLGNERAAITRVTEAVGELDLSPARLERLKTAVAEAVMNAIEHGNSFRADQPVEVAVLTAPGTVRVDITDQGGSDSIATSVEPDLAAKLSGLQTPRGWGLFLIKNMVDEMRVSSDGARHTVSLLLQEQEPADDQPRA
jgi:serine phosphatase RsbU (regulator of sigma subunit)/anti-sigma regulatory factor (Ser/Thr protein kinase)